MFVSLLLSCRLDLPDGVFAVKVIVRFPPPPFPCSDLDVMITLSFFWAFCLLLSSLLWKELDLSCHDGDIL